MSDPTLYGPAHQAERARWQTRLDAGETILCARGCGRTIDPEHWDLGHTRNRRGWSGPECPPCNRATRSHMAADRKRPPERHPGALT